MGALYKAPLYQETGNVDAEGRIELSRLGNTRAADAHLKDKKIDLIAGNLYCYKMPDLTRQNEAYLEVNVMSELKDGESVTNVPYSWKKKVAVKDKTNSADVAGQRLFIGAKVGIDGLTLQIRLTELDQMDQEKFTKLQAFISENNIPELVQKLAATAVPASAGLDLKAVSSLVFNSIKLFDELNDDDRVWIEGPLLGLRAQHSQRLYEGSYAFVGERKNYTPPERLWKNQAGELFVKGGNGKYTSFDESIYFTFQILGSMLEE